MTGPLRVSDLTPAGQELARLVPAVYFARDEALADRPLLRLLEVLAAPLAELDAALDTALDDHFVERARAEVLPLLAELVGARLLGTDERTNRAVVAATVRWRRRKGTLATLTEVLATTTGWATEVDEAARSLLATQDLEDQLPFRGATADLTNPISLADPLSRAVAGGPAATGASADGTPDVAMQLRRIGATDALRPAVSPRTLDLAGWVRPERVVVRTSRLAVREVDRQEIVHVLAVAHREDPPGGPARFAGISLDPRGVQLDPQGRPVPFPLAAVRASGEPPVQVTHVPSEADGSAALLDPLGGPRALADLLTPTALALDPRAADHDVLTLFADDVVVAGGGDSLPVPQPLPYAPPGALPALRFADAGRPAPGERWALDLIAIDRPDSVATGPADPSVAPATAAGADNPFVLRSTAEPDLPGPVTVTAAGTAQRSGAQLALRLQRLQQSGYRRSSTRQWATDVGLDHRGRPISPLVWVAGLPEALLVRVERGDPGLVLSRVQPDTPAPAWESFSLDCPGLDLAAIGDAGSEGPILGAAGGDDVVLLIGPAASGSIATTPTLGVWRVEAPGAAVAVGATLTGTRIDDGGRAPTQRVLAATCLAGDSLWLYGGQDRRATTPQVLADLWSIPAGPGAARSWVRLRTRHAPPRMGSRLLARGASLVLVGGAQRPAELATSVHTVDPGAARPVWTELPALPVESGGPGVLWGRVDGAGPDPELEVVAWPDRTRPRTLRLAAGARAWTDLGPDTGAPPNPPAEDAATFVGADLAVAGPVPLPPTEVVLSTAGAGHLAFLPALDPPDGGVEILLLETDGSATRWLPPGEFRDTNLRLGAGREEPYRRRAAPGSRMGIPGRLAWQPLRIRQLSLGLWDQQLVIDLAGAIGVDPRLGRVLAPREIAAGARLSASYRTGRADAIGAGFAPPGRVLPDDWAEPADPVDPDRFVPAVAPDLDTSLPGGPIAATALLQPSRAGQVIGGIPVVARLVDGIRADAPLVGPGRRAHVIRVPGSPRLAPAAVTLPQGDVLSLYPAASGAVAHIGSEDGVSLRLQERIAPGERPDVGPSWFLSGLSTDGAVEVLVTAGLVDIRWCDLAPPRSDDPPPVPGIRPRTGVRVAGALDGRLPRHPAPGPGSADPDAIGAGAVSPNLTIRLTGCLVGRLEVPSWAQVIAAGCTFDAGPTVGAEAISAAGATLRLRHCTVRGSVRAGVLQASSCLLRGQVECDDPEGSWVRHSGIDPGSPGAGPPPGDGLRGMPLRYQCLVGPIDFAASAATDPRYLVPSEANPEALLRSGERGLQPGAHGRRTRGLAELAGRTTDFLPLGLVPDHLDRAAADLVRLNRRTP